MSKELVRISEPQYPVPYINTGKGFVVGLPPPEYEEPEHEPDLIVDDYRTRIDQGPRYGADEKLEIPELFALDADGNPVRVVIAEGTASSPVTRKEPARRETFFRRHLGKIAAAASVGVLAAGALAVEVKTNIIGSMFEFNPCIVSNRPDAQGNNIDLCVLGPAYIYKDPNGNISAQVKMQTSIPNVAGLFPNLTDVPSETLAIPIEDAAHFMLQVACSNPSGQVAGNDDINRLRELVRSNADRYANFLESSPDKTVTESELENAEIIHLFTKFEVSGTSKTEDVLCT